MLGIIIITMILAMICLPHADGGSQSITWGAWDLKISQAPTIIFSLSETFIFLTFWTFVRDPLTERQNVLLLVCEPFIWKAYVYFVFCNTCILSTQKSFCLLCFLQYLHTEQFKKLVFSVFCTILAYWALQKAYVYCVFCNRCIPMDSKSLYLRTFW